MIGKRGLLLSLLLSILLICVVRGQLDHTDEELHDSSLVESDDEEEEDESSDDVIQLQYLLEEEEQIIEEKEDPNFQLATDKFNEGVRKRRYRFWMGYDPEDDWTVRKDPENVQGAKSLLEEAGALGLDDAYYVIGEMYEYGEFGAIDFVTARSYYEKAAKTGNPNAQAALGFMYGTGKNVTVNEPLSQLYLLFAARSGDTSAQMTMGYKYLHGHGTPKSCSMAAEWYELAAAQAVSDSEEGMGSYYQQIRLSAEAEAGRPHQQDEDVVQYYQYSASAGDPNALVTMGNLHLTGGYGVERNYQKAFGYFQQAANLQDPAGISSVGYMHANGWGVDQNNQTAIKYYRQAADLGNAHAQTQLGIFYYHGWDMQRNFKEAHRWFKLADDQDYSEAQLYLGHMHYNGEGVPKDLALAFKYYALAAAKDHISGIYHFAEMHLLGQGTGMSCPAAVMYFKRVAERGLWSELLSDAHDLHEEGNYETALLVYEKLAEMGFEVAQSNAAWMYEKLLGIRPSTDGSWPTLSYTEKASFRYYSRSAEQQNPDAHLRLGDYYFYGKGTSVSLTKAASCYDSAAKLRSHQALFNLGYMHEHGIGLSKDLFLAKRYYDAALALNEDAYLAVGLALVKLAFHFVYDIASGEQSIASLGLTPSPALEKIRAVPWDNVFIFILSIVLGVLLVIRQRRLLR